MRTFFGLVVLALVATAARGATIIVPPGPGTPVQDAINAANPGDTIRLTNASYPEHLQITKAVKLRGSARGVGKTKKGDPLGRPSLFSVK